ncbi:MAG: carboxypeptidase regulatory-like domain-containing protein [Candidatus Sulfotelmatobacter sp.]
MHLNCPRGDVRSGLVVMLGILFLISSSWMFGQATLATGSIVGTVTDPSGAVVVGAKVTITRIDMNQVIEVKTNGAGTYYSGPLIPDQYKVRISAKGFNSISETVTVEVDNTATANGKLVVGQETAVVISMQGNDVDVNTEQPIVQGVLTATEIENLPINGRNFLDLAQLEPGVQIQDGQDFDPTKAGFSSISFGGRFGRTARIEVDGVDVSDETVGTTTTGIPASAIQEFQLSQSSLDMSTELTSSGSVNVTTKSGTNAVHGEAFGQFRDSTVGAAALPTPPPLRAPFQRSQFGGDVGGPIRKDKAFFFLDGERTVQNTQSPVPISPPFQQYSGTFNDPFRETNVLGRVDYLLPHDARAFYRFTYFKNFLAANNSAAYSLYDNKDITRTHAVGLDFNTGNYTHSFRFSYLKFENEIVDATIGTGLPFANLGAEIFMGNTGLDAGPNFLAPQGTPQSNHEIKYDGGRVMGAHTIRYGVAYDRIWGGGFASFYLNGPSITSQVSQAEIAGAAGGPFANGAANPLNYPADAAVISNGLGYTTSVPALGFPAGGLGPDNRIQLYLGDNWKARPNFTLTYGLRYVRDTSRTDSQFPAIPQLDNLFPSLGNQVRQPNLNFAPMLGFAWDPSSNGKTSIRGGVGLYYENALWNNVLADAPQREATGAFLQQIAPCSSPGQPNSIPTSNGTLNAPGSASAIAICGASGANSFPLIGDALPAILALQQAYIAGSPFNLHTPNPSFVGSTLAGCNALPSSASYAGCYFTPGVNLFNPNYRSPRSVQMNLGIQHELKPGTVISVDFIRNVQTHYLLGVDQNHSGDVRHFNLQGAQNAITATLLNCGASSVTQSWSQNCPSGRYTNPDGTPRPLNIGDFAAFGLGSSTDMGGSSCPAGLVSAFSSIAASTGDRTLITMFPNGYGCAFGGLNQNAPPLNFLSPVGRSVYDGAQVKLVDNVKHPFPGAKSMNLKVSYALSRFENSGGGVAPDASVEAGSGDQDSAVPALDNANVNRYFGASALDRTHQVSFGAYIEFPKKLQMGIMSHFYSPLATTLTVPDTGLGAGEIFRTDFSGDGTTQDPIPGTHNGSFMHGVDNSSIGNVISSYNAKYGGQPTPAGNVLVAGLPVFINATDLAGLGAVAPLVSVAPTGQANMSWLKTLDATIGWQHTFFERVTIKPSVGVYNVFNFANFDLPNNMMSGLLTGTPGSINGTTYGGHVVNRVGVGTGVYSLGSPRQTEFSLKIEF